MRDVVTHAMLLLLLGAVSAYAAYQVHFGGALSERAATSELRLQQAVDRLLGQLDIYKVLVNEMAANEQASAMLRAPAGTDAAETALERKLARIRLSYGLQEIGVYDRNRNAFAISKSIVRPRPIPDAANTRELFAAALEGRLGFFIHLSPERGEHVAYFSRGIYDSAPSPTAVVLVAVNLSDLEYNWQAGPEAVIFVTAANRVATSNRPSLRYRVLDEANARLSASAPAADAPQHTATAVKTINGHRLWKLPPSKDLPSEALIISQDVPRIGLKAHAFVDIKPLRRAALSVATFIASVILAIGVIAVLIALQRRNMRRLLSLEEAANRRLEARVAERTLELQAAQDQLVQASKMTALGQMSAAIGHELNQPLAAILNFSDNGAKFLAGGRTEEARENFGRISKLVARIDRIITNLRGFARKEAGAVETTDLVDAIHGATDLVRPRLDRAGATLIKAFGDEPIWVQAGPVRLQQIFVNLLTNAIDAVEASNRKEIRIAVRETDEWIVADVSDTGGGAAEPERVFEPFYSTKTGRGEDGTGLGLSITFEVVRQFGGQITCQNRELGAVFELRLRRGRKQRAEIAGDHQTTTRLPEAAE